jgi:hypothetical protein
MATLDIPTENQMAANKSFKLPALYRGRDAANYAAPLNSIVIYKQIPSIQ